MRFIYQFWQFIDNKHKLTLMNERNSLNIIKMTKYLCKCVEKWMLKNVLENLKELMYYENMNLFLEYIIM